VKVWVRAFAGLREILGDELTVELPDDSAMPVLLREISDHFPEAEELIYEPDGYLSDSLVLIINGNEVGTAYVEGALLADGDEVVLFPGVGGE